MLKVAVFGRGRVGRSVSKLCSEKGHAVSGYSRSGGCINGFVWNQINYEAPEVMLSNKLQHYDMIINCAGDVSLTSASRKINIDLPLKLSKVAKEHKLIFVHFGSTGYLSLFDILHLSGDGKPINKRIIECPIECWSSYEEQKLEISRLLKNEYCSPSVTFELLLPGYSETLDSAPWLDSFIDLQRRIPLRLAPSKSGLNLCFERTLSNSLDDVFTLVDTSDYHVVLSSEFVPFDDVYSKFLKRRYRFSVPTKIWSFLYKIAGKRTRSRIRNLCNIVRLIPN